MNVEASLFHHSPWYVEQVYEESAGKYSVFSVFRHENKDKAPPFILIGLSKGNVSKLPKKVNSAADTNWFLLMQTQTGFFPADFDNLPIHELIAHFQNPCSPACQNFHTISEHNVPNSVTQKVEQGAAVPSKSRHSYWQHWQQLVFLFLAHPEGINSTQMPFSFLNILKFLQQKRAFRATYMQVMTHEFKITFSHKPQWN